MTVLMSARSQVYQELMELVNKCVIEHWRSRLCLQGTCEWMEGVLRPQGSQDISPPKDTTEDAQPAQAPAVENPAAHARIGAAPGVPAPAPAEEPAAEQTAAAEPAASAEVGRSRMTEASCEGTPLQ